MSYYHELNLTREPFSNSPDPDFFYRTQDRVECLNLMEVHIRLKRGLCVLLGDIGTGKTTLCRQLLLEMQGDDMLQSYLLLDPQFRSAKEFLRVLYGMIVGSDTAGLSDFSEWQLKEGLKKALFELSVTKGKTIVLLIDEGQRLRHDGIELLRELLNYETNSSKLLQIVIFAQNEFKEALHSYANFADRISTILYIGPFVFRETVEMIHFRIRETQESPSKIPLFTLGALRAIHKASAGYPRKIVIICHKALLQIILDNKTKVTAKTIRKISEKESFTKPKNRIWYYAASILLLFATSVYLLNGSATTSSSEATKEATGSTLEAGSISTSVQKTAPSVRVELTQPKVAVQQPEMLGEIRLAEKVPLGLLIKQVYGSDRKVLRRLVRENNPEIRQLDTLPAGTELHLPLIMQTPGSSFKGMFWLELASYRTLQEACTALQKQVSSAFPAALLVSFTSSKGVRFSIVVKEIYASETAALETLEELPASIRVHSKIVRNWGERAILYTTPDAWPREAAKSALIQKLSERAS